MTCGGTWLYPGDFRSLQFLDFPGWRWCQIRRYLLGTEPGFMRYLTRDVKVRGFEDPAELARGEIGQGTHRMVVAHLLELPMPVVRTAFHWEFFDTGVRRRARDWHEIRRRLFPDEYRQWLEYTQAVQAGEEDVPIGPAA